ncbi:MAG TPA: hypothetical protein VG408_02665, partial [Actinomycetota bacterium]|nr:hypothetical protein [Actinomycetota bacterium]
MHGELDEDWRDSSIVIGRLAFVGARDYRDAPSRWFRKRRDGTYRTHKIMIQIENGADMTVRIPKPHRRKSALAYDPALFNERLRIRDADYEVIFDVCANVVENPHRADVTQYNGGFVVARARCVPVNVLNGEGERIKRIRI